MLGSAAAGVALVLGRSVVGASGAQAWDGGHGGEHGHDQTLTPRTSFVMAPDGSSGATAGGEGIPNIDSVKKTIATYYGDPGTGIANKTTSPYISEMSSIINRETAKLKYTYLQAVRRHQKPAIVFDADDTTLWT